MTRRIVLAVLALVAAVLGVVAVPLGVITANQDTRDFRDEAAASATTLANAAEERLDDGASIAPLDRAVRQLSRDGDLVSVLNKAGAKVAWHIRLAAGCGQPDQARGRGAAAGNLPG